MRRASVGITDKELEKSPFDLSGGQKRRAAIAGVIAMEPDVLILDEPTAGLDPVGRESILENIRAYQAAQGASVIMVSHSMEEIASNVDRLLVMNDSHLVMDATPAEVFAKPEELVQMGLAVPKVTQVLLKLRELGVDVPASAVYGGAGGKAAASARERREGRMLKDMTLGQYFPGETACPQNGSQNKACARHRVHRGAVCWRRARRGTRLWRACLLAVVWISAKSA